MNPEVNPERYRVTCRKAFRQCEKKAKEVCEGRFTTLQRLSNVPEQRPVSESDLSSTGPSQGPASFRGEMVVECGEGLAPLRLERAPGAEPPASVPSPAPREEPLAEEPVCVPGSTQACLGPGACSGAQACRADGRGFEACDCGPNPSPRPGESPPNGGEAAPLAPAPGPVPATPAPAPPQAAPSVQAPRNATPPEKATPPQPVPPATSVPAPAPAPPVNSRPEAPSTNQ